MSTSTLPFDMQPFCEKEDRGRYAMSKPYVHKGWLCATDGAIGVMVPAPNETETVSDKKLPDLTTVVLPNVERNLDWQPWPESVEVEQKETTCERCDGNGYDHTKKCPSCDGDGTDVCGECGHERDCSECNGEGFVGCGKCKACDGKKKLMQPYSFRVDGKRLAAKYESMIRAIPGVEFAIVNEAVVFRSPDGVAGMVMMMLED